jgi:hypothetical protein
VFKLIVPLDAGDAATETDAESYKPPAIKKQLTPAEIVTVIVSENANPMYGKSGLSSKTLLTTYAAGFAVALPEIAVIRFFSSTFKLLP